MWFFISLADMSINKTKTTREKFYGDASHDPSSESFAING
jgi:hypothetical protein